MKTVFLTFITIVVAFYLFNVFTQGRYFCLQLPFPYEWLEGDD